MPPAPISTSTALPDQIEDISDYRLICQSTASSQVGAGLSLIQQLLMYDIKSLLTVNNYFGVLQGVVNNLGIGVLPDYLINDFPDSCVSCRMWNQQACRSSSPTPRAAAIQTRGRLPRLCAGRNHHLPQTAQAAITPRAPSHAKYAYRPCLAEYRICLDCEQGAS